MNSIQRWMLPLLGAGLVACSSDSRNEPSPAEMCENLATECSGFQSEVLNDCQRIGERGEKNAESEDACYVYYDTCIDQCRFYAEFGEGLEAGAGDGGAPGDGGADADETLSSTSDGGALAGDVPEGGPRDGGPAARQ